MIELGLACSFLTTSKGWCSVVVPMLHRGYCPLVSLEKPGVEGEFEGS